MQPVVEPDLGLCDNLKPNRFFGAERKRFYRALLLQGPLFYQRQLYKNEYFTTISFRLERTNRIQIPVSVWLQKDFVSNQSYIFIWRLSTSGWFSIFERYLLPNYTSAKIVERILEGKIIFEQIQKAAQYEEKIKPRLEALIHLKTL